MIVGISDYFGNEGQDQIMKLYVFSNQVFVLERIAVTARRNDGHKGETKKRNGKDPWKDECESTREALGCGENRL